MWRWSVFLFLLLSSPSLSQPLTDENQNDRQPRQLDFGECCPCLGAGQTERGFTEQESVASARDSTFRRAGDLDLCPCNARQSDSEGAASVFFPTAMRADGASVRASEKKEDVKPLLHPEVDLASSVLQTLRDVTEEEYQDALARDAARSVAKAAEETIFGDATPEASGNVVTIIVNPKDIENEDDFMTQESRITEPRCTHSSLQNVRTERSKMRMDSNPPSLLRDIIGLSNSKNSENLLSRNYWDMDNSVGASNIQERTVNLEEEQNIIKAPTKLIPLKNRLDSKFRNLKMSPTAKSSADDEDGDSEISKIKPTSGLNVKDLLSNRLSFDSLPKMKMITKTRDSEDLKFSPSNIREHEIKNILQNTGPISLRNLLKLKDVELVPLKDLINNRAAEPATIEPAVNKKSKLTSPDILKHEKDLILTRNNKHSDLGQKKGLRNILPRSNVMLDPEVSPSQNIENIHMDNCPESTQTREESGIANNDNSLDSTESLDNQLNSDTQSDLNNESSDANQSHLENNIDLSGSNKDCEKLQETDTTLVEDAPTNSEERDLDPQTEGQESVEMHSQPNCIQDNVENEDSLTDSSKNINTIVEPTDDIQNGLQDITANDAAEPKDCSQEREVNDEEDAINNNNDSGVIRPSSLNDTLNSIKENIKKTLESLRIPKSSSRMSNLFNRKTIDPVDDKELSTNAHKTQQDIEENCSQSEDSLPTTTIKPEDSNDDAESEASNNVTMQDLQDKSNAMLEEEEKQLKDKAAECGEQSEELPDPKEISDLNMENTNTGGTELEDLDISPNNKNEIVINSRNTDDIGNTDDKNTCVSDSIPDKQSNGMEFRPMERTINNKEMDSNGEASEVIINRVPCIGDVVGSPNTLFEQRTNIMETLLPKSQDLLKLSSLPTLNDLSLGLNDLFDNSPRAVVEPNLNSEPAMKTDASTNILRSESPLRLEGIDLSKLQLPRLELPQIQPKLPLIKDLNLKPLKLQSSLTEKGKGRRISNFGRNNQLKSISNLEDFELIPHQLSDFSDNLHSHAKNAWKDVQRTVQSKLSETAKGAKRLQTPNLLDVIAQNHEDVNDKLRALHIDFNDRLETMRNSLFDNTRLIGSDSLRTPKLKPFDGLGDRKYAKQLSLQSNQPKSISSRRKESKTLTSRRLEQQRKSGPASLKTLNEKRFKMPASASVPVPKTVEIPQLRAAATKYSAPAIQRPLAINVPTRNLEATPKRTSFDRHFDQAGTNLRKTPPSFGKKINPFKDSKIKVSFSTTPRPSVASSTLKGLGSSQIKNTNIGKSRSVFDQRDANGLPSEVVNSMVSPTSGQNLDTSGNGDGRQSFISSDTVNFVRTPTLGKKEINREVVPKHLQSWPKASESAFLSKVREAVKARLTKLDAHVKAKQSVERNSVKESRSLDTDMARSASTDVVVVDKPMKENVSYKCTMMCTKE